MGPKGTEFWLLEEREFEVGGLTQALRHRPLIRVSDVTRKGHGSPRWAVAVWNGIRRGWA